MNRTILLVMMLVVGSSTLLAFNILGANKPKRVFQPEDIGRIEALGKDTIPSPDGRIFAYVRIPSRAGRYSDWSSPLGRIEGADIWLTEVGRGSPEIIAHGSEGGMGFGYPQWSPDGAHLALISVSAGDVGLTIWQKDSRKLIQVVKQNINVASNQPCKWITNSRLICEMRAGSSSTSTMGAAAIATQEWAKALRGEVPTASVLQSNSRETESTLGYLSIIDIGEGIVGNISGEMASSIVPYSNGHLFALWRYNRQPELDQHRGFHSSIKNWQLLVIDDKGRIISGPFYLISGAIDPLDWSKDGSEVSILDQHQSEDGMWHVQWVKCPVHGKKCTTVNEKSFAEAINDCKWSLDGQPIVHGSLLDEVVSAGSVRRADWWILGSDGQFKNVSSGLQKVPEHLWAEKGRNSFVGVADGQIWRIRLNDMNPEKIGPQFDKHAGVVWSDDTGRDLATTTIIVQSKNGELSHLYRIDLGSKDVDQLHNPSPRSELSGYSAVTGTALWQLADQTGTYLWRCTPKPQACSLLVETNTFLRDIAQGAISSFQYKSLEGESLTAWLIQPAGYKAGLRYPVVTWVYPGTSELDDAFVDSSPNPFKLQLLAARGYAVLIPSMPRLHYVLEGSASSGSNDPYMELMNGVMPAVDRVVDMGIADPDRLGVMGHSFGGFAVCGLITQTTRFKSAVELSGFVDLVSDFGTFSGRDRYAPQIPTIMWGLEGGQIGMHSTPWGDLDRYIRNSPLFYADRVETPLMIIQGDMDYVPIQQGEEFFSALSRQRKRAEFVRYWGEGHIIGNNPANLVDMWRRILAWFDEFLKPDQAGAAPTIVSDTSPAAKALSASARLISAARRERGKASTAI